MEKDAKQGGGRKWPTVLRGALHVLITLCGWGLFFYWWGCVLPAISTKEAGWALLYILVVFLLTGLLTVGWVRYNVGIYRRKGPRRNIPEARETFDKDALGRNLAHPGLEALRTARLVVVSVTGDDGKTLSAGER